MEAVMAKQGRLHLRQLIGSFCSRLTPARILARQPVGSASAGSSDRLYTRTRCFQP